jgi:hypothetical protein
MTLSGIEPTTFRPVTERESKNKKSEAITVTDRGGLYGCEMLKIPYCLDNRLTDGGRLSALRAGPLYQKKNFWYSFLLETESTSPPSKL